MATYGKYEVISHPSGYAVTNMQTHNWMHEDLIADQAKAHRLARKLMDEDRAKRAVANTSEYLTIDHPDAHVDFPTADEKRQDFVRMWNREPLATCPKCHGRGGWNLQLNQYPLPVAMDETRENRHMYCHFRASCSQCNGWGFVSEKRDAECIHDAEETAHDSALCLTSYRCRNCSAQWQIDSSG